MPIPVRALTAALEDKFGFTPMQSDDERFLLYVDGELAAHTKVSRSWKEVGTSMVPTIARQLHVSEPELSAMVACTFGPDAYLQRVLAKTPDKKSASKPSQTQRKPGGPKKHRKKGRRQGR
jgi:hypothetical protein